MRPKLAYKALPKLTTGDPAGPCELLALDGEGPWTLKLVGLQDAELKESRLQVDEQASRGENAAIQVLFKAESALASDAKVARLWIDQRRVLFSWDRDLRGGIELASAQSLRDCVLEVLEADQVRWTVVLRERRHQGFLHLDVDHLEPQWTLDWGSDPPPARSLNLGKCKIVLKPGAKDVGAEIATDPVPRDDAMAHDFTFNVPGGKPVHLNVRLRAITNRPIVVYPEFSPTIAELKKEGNLKANEWKQLKKELEALTQVLPPNEQVRQQIQSQIQQFKPRHDELDAEIKVIEDQINYIESISDNYQMSLQIGFEVDDRDIEIYTFGDEEARDP